MTQFKTRRFVEDSTTWNNLRNLGVPNDSYGMPYRIPIGYTALLKYTNFPVFIGQCAVLSSAYSSDSASRNATQLRKPGVGRRGV